MLIADMEIVQDGAGWFTSAAFALWVIYEKWSKIRAQNDKDSAEKETAKYLRRETEVREIIAVHEQSAQKVTEKLKLMEADHLAARERVARLEAICESKDHEISSLKARLDECEG